MYQKSPKGWIKHIDFLLLDIFTLEISLYLLYIVRHKDLNILQNEIYMELSIILLFVNILSVFFNSPYTDIIRRGYLVEAFAIFKHTLTIFLFTIFWMFSFQMSEEFSRIVIMGTMLLFFFLSYFVHFIWKDKLRRNMKNGADKSLLLVTISSQADEMVSYLKQHNYNMHTIVGVALLDKEVSNRTKIKGVPIVAYGDSVIEYACREWVDEVMISIPFSFSYPIDLVEKFKEMGITSHVIMNELYSLGDDSYVQHIDGIPVLTTGMKYVTVREMFSKRLLDIFGGIVGSFITIILTIIIGPLIYIKSPGPIFFKQERVGKNGKKFQMYKFRSMYLDAEKRKADLMKKNQVGDGMMFKLEEDPRIIGSEILQDGTYKKGIGNFIRDYSLDEFPQFFNVLKGEMSLVGTRPPTVDEWEKYDFHHRTRLAIKPGITGNWQISGRSKITDFEQVVKLDNDYIQNWTLAEDIKILFKTVFAVIKKEGSM